MLDVGMLSVNTFDKGELPKARRYGIGLEVEEYLWQYDQAEIGKIRGAVPLLMEGFPRFSFHGTAVGRDLAAINQLPDQALLDLYNQSYGYADYHGIRKIVFHGNYLAGGQSESSWIQDKAAFWKGFLADKPSDIHVYLENFIHETPDMMAQLCDEVDDPRFRLCLDTGHANCNSHFDLPRWIARLGRRVEHVHLHNNDGLSDQHRPLGMGVLDMKAVIILLLESSGAETYVIECNLSESLEWLFDSGLLRG